MNFDGTAREEWTKITIHKGEKLHNSLQQPDKGGEILIFAGDRVIFTAMHGDFFLSLPNGGFQISANLIITFVGKVEDTQS